MQSRASGPASKHHKFGNSANVGHLERLSLVPKILELGTSVALPVQTDGREPQVWDPPPHADSRYGQRDSIAHINLPLSVLL